MSFLTNEEQNELNAYDERLSGLIIPKAFSTESNTQTQNNVNKIKRYFRMSLAKSSYKYKDQAILKRYGALVTQLERVKTGEVSADEALAEIKKSATLRKVYVSIYNIIKAAEIVFWA